MPKNIDEKGNLLKYDGFPFITNIDAYVQNELSNRSLGRVRPIVPFIKVTPGFSPDGSESSKIVLKGIEAPNDKNPMNYKFDDLYRPQSFFRPPAGVKSVSVDYLNALGSIKKATVSWVCHTLEDLERLSPFFLNPGLTMFIEWGWSNYAKDVINNTHLDLDGNVISLKSYLDYVKEQRKRTNGNYDGMIGVVVNYSFSLNNDGGFECVTEVVSAGFLMQGITIPNQHTQDASGNPKGKNLTEVEKEQLKKFNDAQKKKEENEKIKVLETLQSFVQNRFYAQIRGHLKDSRFTDANAKHDYFLLSVEGTKNGVTQLVNADTSEKTAAIEVAYDENDNIIGYSNSTNNKKFTGDNVKLVKLEIPLKASVYASWGYLEDYVINPHVAIKGINDELLFGFDSRGAKIGSHKYLRSTDLGICIIPQANPGGGAISLPNFKAGETDTNTLDFGYVRRLLINVEYFREVFLNARTINDAVLQLFSGINDACINFWNFRLIPIEERFDESSYGNIVPNDQIRQQTDFNFSNNNRYVKPENSGLGGNRKSAMIAQKIVDIEYSARLLEDEKSKEGLYVFRTKTFSIENKKTGQIENNVTSVVRNMSFQSKLSHQAALNVFYSAQNNDGRVMGTPNSNTFQSLYDFSVAGTDFSNAKDTFSYGPFYIDAAENNTDASIGDNTVDPGTTTDPLLIAQEAYGDALTHFLPIKSKGYWVKIGNKNLTGIEGMKMAVLLDDGSGVPPAKSDALVPLNIEIELEGISGIRIGDLFTIDHIPTIYRKHGSFQIIGITDTIDKNSWVTKLKAGFRVFRSIDYQTVRFSPQQYDKTLNQSNLSAAAQKAPVNPPDDLVVAMRTYDITDPLEKAHFLAQTAHESAAFRTTKEYADGSEYEGRSNLGNTQAGDGVKFKGRGYLQLTGRFNYTAYQKYLTSKGITDDIISNPDLVSSKYAADSACFYWKILRNITPYAEQGSTPEDVVSVTRIINPGLNGLDDRISRFNGYWSALEKNNSLYT